VGGTRAMRSLPFDVAPERPCGSVCSRQARVGNSAATDPDACSLLAEDQVSAAIEAKSQTGQHGGKTSTKTCIWSDEAKISTDHRRVTLSITTLTGFNVGKSVPRTTADPVAGLGYDAY
jgi:hypothetical protein